MSTTLRRAPVPVTSPGLPADQYDVYEVGDMWAEIREGYRGPIGWRERYDWSVPGRIQWTTYIGHSTSARV
jgi:hypothetical protein